MQTVRRSKRLWFEQHRWSMISGGHLLVGGRDAKGNDSIVKKHLSGGDMYLHADIHGAPSCSLVLRKDLRLLTNLMANFLQVFRPTNSSINSVMNESMMRNSRKLQHLRFAGVEHGTVVVLMGLCLQSNLRKFPNLHKPVNM